MWRLGAVVVAVLVGGVYSAAASASPAPATVDLVPASTSVDHAPSCEVPDAPTIAPSAGGTLVTFTLFPAGCE